MNCDARLCISFAVSEQNRCLDTLVLLSFHSFRTEWMALLREKKRPLLTFELHAARLVCVFALFLFTPSHTQPRYITFSIEDAFHSRPYLLQTCANAFILRMCAANWIRRIALYREWLMSVLVGIDLAYVFNHSPQDDPLVGAVGAESSSPHSRLNVKITWNKRTFSV